MGGLKAFFLLHQSNMIVSYQYKSIRYYSLFSIRYSLYSNVLLASRNSNNFPSVTSL